MQTKREMYDRPNHFCGLENGEYPAWKVHAEGSKLAMLAVHLPNTDPSFKAAIVEDGYVVGVVREYADAHPVVAAPAAAPPATQSPLPVENPEPDPELDPDAETETTDPEPEPETEAAPVSRNWAMASNAEIAAEFVKRGWKNKGTRKERIARLEA